MDVLVAGQDGNHVSWFENDGGDGLTWVQHVIDTTIPSATLGGACDVDCDGDLDVFVVCYATHVVVWFENTNGDGSFWSKREIDGFFEGARWGCPVDMDKDGDLDLVAVGEVANEVVWFENTNGNGTAWAKQIIALAYDGAIGVHARDFDRE